MTSRACPLAVSVLGPDGPARDATLASIDVQTVAPATTATPIVHLPAGAVLAPTFLEVCGRALAASPDAAYVTTWADAEDAWQARPLGNGVPLVEREDCGGAVLVVARRHAERAAARIGARSSAAEAPGCSPASCAPSGSMVWRFRSSWSEYATCRIGCPPRRVVRRSRPLCCATAPAGPRDSPRPRGR